ALAVVVGRDGGRRWWVAAAICSGVSDLAGRDGGQQCTQRCAIAAGACFVVRKGIKRIIPGNEIIDSHWARHGGGFYTALCLQRLMAGSAPAMTGRWVVRQSIRRLVINGRSRCVARSAIKPSFRELNDVLPSHRHGRRRPAIHDVPCCDQQKSWMP